MGGENTYLLCPGCQHKYQNLNELLHHVYNDHIKNHATRMCASCNHLNVGIFKLVLHQCEISGKQNHDELIDTVQLQPQSASDPTHLKQESNKHKFCTIESSSIDQELLSSDMKLNCMIERSADFCKENSIEQIVRAEVDTVNFHNKSVNERKEQAGCVYGRETPKEPPEIISFHPQPKQTVVIKPVTILDTSGLISILHPCKSSEMMDSNFAIPAAPKNERQRISRDLLKTEPTLNTFIHATDGSNCYTCEVCQVEVSNVTGVSHHLSSVFHQLKLREYDSGTSSAQEHKDRHLTSMTEEGRYTCSECSKTFQTRKALNRHYLIHTKSKAFHCTICGSSFNRSYSFKQHMYKHEHGNPNICHICEKEYFDKASLKRHIRTHTGDKPFRCAVCGNSYSQKCVLKRHRCTNKDSPFTTHNNSLRKNHQLDRRVLWSPNHTEDCNNL